MSADPRGLLLKVDQTKTRLRAMLEQGCMAFANGGAGGSSAGVAGRGDPIVDDRFKGQGNARFAPLSYDYAKAKAGNASHLRKVQKKLGRKVSGMTAVAYQSNTGEMTGLGSGKNLPILVRYGTLRQAVTSGRARVVIAPTGDRGRVIFVRLPKYAKYHAEGSGSLPVRDPVKPNMADRAKMIAVMQRFLSVSLGRNLRVG